MICFRNSRNIDEAIKINATNEVYDAQMDIGTAKFALYFKEWLNVGVQAPGSSCSSSSCLALLSIQGQVLLQVHVWENYDWESHSWRGKCNLFLFCQFSSKQMVKSRRIRASLVNISDNENIVIGPGNLKLSFSSTSGQLTHVSNSITGERCVVHEIGSSVDYRKLTSAEEGFYFVGRNLSTLLKQKFFQLVGQQRAAPQEVEDITGRTLRVPMGDNGCAYFPFEELCDRPLKVIMNFLVADYFGLCKNFHTLALEGVLIFGLHNRSAAYRFVILVDVMCMRIKDDYYVQQWGLLLNYLKG